MAIGDCFNLKLLMTLLGQQCMMSFHYAQFEAGASDPSVSDINPPFYTAVVLPLKNIVSDQLQINGYLVKKEIGSPLEGNYDYADVAGTRTGEVMPPFVAWGFLGRRQFPTTFNGHKRVPGVAEGDVANGVALAGAVTLLNLLGTGFDTQLVIGGIHWAPCILSKVLNGVIRPTPLVNFITGHVFRNVTSQATRKFGRGR